MPAVLIFAPIRGATEDEQQCYEALEFQPTCPVRGTTECLENITQEINISTHVPRTGHDPSMVAIWRGDENISTHVPRTGHDIAATLTIPKVAFSTPVPRTGHDVGTMPCI